MKGESIKPEYDVHPGVLPYAQPRPVQRRDCDFSRGGQWCPVIFSTAFPIALGIVHFAPYPAGNATLENLIVFMFLCCPISNLVGIFLSGLILYQTSLNNRAGLVSLSANLIALTAFVLTAIYFLSNLPNC
jgi:hypothetical protein